MAMEGYKTYLTAAAMIILGLAGYIDPGMAEFIGQLTGIDGAVLLMVAGVIMAVLRNYTKTESKLIKL